MMKELNPKAGKVYETIVKTIDQQGAGSETVSELLMELRKFFIESEDPTVTKVLRLTSEHIAENGSFELNILSDVEVVEEEEEKEENENTGALLEEYSPEDNLKYLLTLCMDANNKYNREELFEIRDQLMDW
ncbi:MAG: hypothetical protein EA392_09360 [Cryomorphaceae bacterium]|nr:MAG: hypothetical protein EA392_09360 [Cryomorphaceae bacterium]